MQTLKELFRKHREILLYVFFGGLTTVVSIGSFIHFDGILHIHELIANVLSWICAVGFAYGTNRR
jgi:putative flippase GtrA